MLYLVKQAAFDLLKIFFFIEDEEKNNTAKTAGMLVISNSVRHMPPSSA
jgi:hypothetical protein